MKDNFKQEVNESQEVIKTPLNLQKKSNKNGMKSEIRSLVLEKSERIQLTEVTNSLENSNGYQRVVIDDVVSQYVYCNDCTILLNFSTSNMKRHRRRTCSQKSEHSLDAKPITGEELTNNSLKSTSNLHQNVDNLSLNESTVNINGMNHSINILYC